MKREVRVVLISFLLAISLMSAKGQSVDESVIATHKPEKTSESYESLIAEYFSQIMGVALSVSPNLKLYQFIYDWIGTPYRWGGDSKRGIDCSKFAFELYHEVFDIMIEDNSRNIFNMVNKIHIKDHLQEGDLIFFKIKSGSISHVGVYLGDNKFVHASSSKGVMISNLSQPYWKKHYYKGGRLATNVNFKIAQTRSNSAKLE